jgi:hypothetical protein
LDFEKSRVKASRLTGFSCCTLQCGVRVYGARGCRALWSYCALHIKDVGFGVDVLHCIAQNLQGVSWFVLMTNMGIVIDVHVRINSTLTSAKLGSWCNFACYGLDTAVAPGMFMDVLFVLMNSHLIVLDLMSYSTCDLFALDVCLISARVGAPMG